MGGESLSSQPQDHLLIIWAFPPPEQALAELSTKLPNLKITFKRVSFDREDPNGSIEALAKELTDGGDPSLFPSTRKDLLTDNNRVLAQHNPSLHNGSSSTALHLAVSH
jgi:hypothetical protein